MKQQQAAVPRASAATLTFLKIFIACFLSVVIKTTYGSPSQPHILFIVADDLGWMDVSYHGSEIQTPYIDRLGAEGVRLENYYVQPICTPSRNCFMTGRYPIRTGLQHGVIRPTEPQGLPLDERTIANALKDVGYATHIVGKWHLGFFQQEYTPTFRGFDTHYGYYLGSEDYFNHTRAFAKFQGLDWRRGLEPVWDEGGMYSTHLLTTQAERIVSQHDPDVPLFLYLPYQAVHDPLQAPSEYVDKYKNIENLQRRIYAGMVTCMDEGVWNITQAFKKYGLWNNTILIWTSDNGGQVPIHSNWPLRGGKNSLWDGGMKVPAFVNSELLDESVRGQASNALLHAVDWYPTLINLAGGSLAQKHPIDGKDVWQTIAKAQPSPRTEMLHDIDPLMPMAAVRVGDWKLVTGKPCSQKKNCGWYPPPTKSNHYAESTPNHASYYEDKEEEEQDFRINEEEGIWLYNITADPTETTDLSPLYPEIVKQLQARIAWYAKGMVPPQTNLGDLKANPALHGGVWSPWR